VGGAPFNITLAVIYLGVLPAALSLLGGILAIAGVVLVNTKGRA